MKIRLVASIDWKRVCYGDSHERVVDLPLAPFPGLVLNRVIGGKFYDEWIVEDVNVDLSKNQISAYIGLHEKGVVAYAHDELVQMAEFLERSWTPT